jgi:putative transposase
MLVTPHLVYVGLGTHDAERRSAYRYLFQEALSASLLKQIRDAGNSSALLGSERFVSETSVTLGLKTGKIRRGRPRTADRLLPQKVL